MFELAGGLGSSWSSLILGEDVRGGEDIGDTFGGDESGWEIGFRKIGPEYNKWGCSDGADWLGCGLLFNGPENACLLNFLEPGAPRGSILANKSPSAKGGGSNGDVALLLLSLKMP